MNIIRKTQSLSNLPNLTEAELGQRSLDWYEHLHGFIPAGRLVEMFNIAVQAHSGRFAINAFDVIRVWNETCAVERTKSKTVTDAPIDCQRCNGSGVETICDDVGRHLGSRPGCDHRAVVEGEGLLLHFQQEAELRHKWRLDRLFKESAREAMTICTRFMEDLDAADLATEDVEEKVDLVRAKGQVRRVWRYLMRQV